jgi:diguanylate cyclase (GGDEF)-like protein
MISLGKFLNSDDPILQGSEPATDALTATTLQCYRAALLAVGKAAIQTCPSLGSDFETNLQGLERRLSIDPSTELVKRTEEQVEILLNEWSARTFGHFKAQSDEVRELFIVLAKTAESFGSRDEGYSNKLTDLTGRMAKIADLQDLHQIKSSIKERVAELKSSVDQMSEENRKLVAQLKTEVSTYETRLRSAELLAMKDPLTNLANRRSIEERIQWNIERGHQFCVAMIDLNGFKMINDNFGHLAGDELLRKLAIGLKKNTRSGDLIGRWGGDEFVLLLSCNLPSTKAHIERLEHWVFGNYKLCEGLKTPTIIHIDGSVGVAEWRPGQTREELIAEADSRMYSKKQLAARPGRGGEI